MSLPQKKIPLTDLRTGSTSDLFAELNASRSKDMVFAVVGYAGSGTSFVAESLGKALSKKGMAVHPIKAREVLDAHAEKKKKQWTGSSGASIEKTIHYQGLGDDLRQASAQHWAVAGYMVRLIKSKRADDKPAVFILDSLKHPHEVKLLRQLYGANFFLIGVGCRPDIRQRRLAIKYKLDLKDAADKLKIDDFSARDAEDSENDYGQQVNDTFHLADYFVDNTNSSEIEANFRLPDQLHRFESLAFKREMYRPQPSERGMYHAHAAAMRSSCLSRQVGASILDGNGTLLSVGTNEVPKFGGGSYEDEDITGIEDSRCFSSKGYCSNTLQQNQIVAEIFTSLQRQGMLADKVTEESLGKSLKRTRVKALIEFSRAVHAEMDALMSLVRAGTKLEKGSTLYSTTYPCHSCARHIVAAGITSVYYLEPYAKSLAIDLHDDSIADNVELGTEGQRVRFLPYQGVSPRFYAEVFLKRSRLKDNTSGKFHFDTEEHIQATERVLWKKTYLQFEADIEQFLDEVLDK